MKKKHLRFNLILSGLFLLLLVIGITFKLLPDTFSNFVAIENVWSGETATSFNGGNGTVDNPYQISRGEELAYFKKVIEGNESDSYKDKYYVITDNIDMGNIDFEPIGVENKLFSGHLDGQGYVIQHLKISGTTIINNVGYTGLFSVIDNASINNLNLNGVEINMKDTSNSYYGALSGSITNSSNINNLSLRNVNINIEKGVNTKDSKIGTVAGYLNNSSIKNSVVKANINNKNTANKVFLVSSLGSSTTLSNILVLSNVTDDTSYQSVYTASNMPSNFFETLNEANSLYSWQESDDGYYLSKTLNNKKRSVEQDHSTLELHESGVSGNTVYVNDLDSDYYYYMGLNYTTNDEVKLPTMENKKIYQDSNLVGVKITYSGVYSRNGSTLRGTVSTTETQNSYIYYKIYPVNNNNTSSTSDDYIMIELIDNPFTNRPKDYGFNGWQTAYRGAEISYDDTYYVRYAKVPVTYTSGKPDDIIINFTAVWTEADVRFSNSNSTSNLTNAISAFKDKGMQQRETTKIVQEPIYGTIEDNDMSDYYIQDTVAYNTVYPSGTYDNTGAELAKTTGTITARNGLIVRSGPSTRNGQVGSATYGSTVTVLEYSTSGNGCNDRWARITTANGTTGYACSTYIGSITQASCTTRAGCTVYKDQSGTTYDETKTYYYLLNGRMTELDPSTLDPNPVIGYNDVEYELFSSTDNMSGYYEQVSLARYASLSGYYNASGVLQTSGTCNQASCTYYRLIQYYDENGNPNNFTKDKNYYYLVTRDTNLIILQAALTGAWRESQTKPLTITSSYGGTLYNVTWTLSNTYIKANDDLGVENVLIYANRNHVEASPSSSTTGARMFYGNWHNVKIGRGIKRTATNQVNFDTAIGGGNGNTGSSSNLTKYRFIVESGYYTTTSQTCGSTSSYTAYIKGEVIYGNDYDRVTKNNDNLDVWYTASGSWGCTIRAATRTDNGINQTFKSGRFGSSHPTTIPNNDSNNFTYGVYVGGRSYGRTHTTRIATIEGGWIYNLIGGPLVDNDIVGYNSSLIYMKGGEVEAIYGGAGVTETYGNRVIQITGGTVNFSVFGGSNGITGSGTNGTLTGSPYIYVGGNAVIGNEDNVNNNRTLFGFEAGSVFGIGNGKENYDSIGTASNSYIIIDESATILKNVYGGGNYGAVGIQVSSSETYINILNGTIKGSVYGGGNRNGSGSATRPSTVHINMVDGTIGGSIYGGSNEEGTIFGDVFINHTGGTIYTDIYGGGYGGYSNTSSGTYISGDVNVNIGSKNSDTTPIIEGSVYGGSAFGTVNGTTRNNNVSNKNVNVTVDKGTIKNSVFGGGKGNSTYTPYVLGNINVTINDGNITDVFGGNDAAGIPNGEINVYLNGGIIGRTFGGGNNAGVHTNHVYLRGATVTEIYGGSNASGNVDSSNVETTSGTVDTVYGGNNIAGETMTSNVTINGGTIKKAVYGGGRQAPTDTTNVTIYKTHIPSVFGGGEEASVETITNIVQEGGEIDQLFGGSNTSGNIPKSSIIINNGTDTDVYGGNNLGGITNDTNITVNNGTITNIYGGGNQVGVTDSHINLVDGVIENVYGGSNQKGDVSTTTILTPDNAKDTLSVKNVYGGNNLGGTTRDTDITLKFGNYVNIFGGGNQADTTNDTSIVIQDITVEESVYGGGNMAPVLGNPTVHVYGKTNIKKNVFGGGNHGAIGEEGKDTSVVKVHLAGAIVGKNVYGGCNTSYVYGVTEVYIGKSALNEHEGVVAGDISVTGTIFGGGESNEAGSDVYDYNAISVTKGITVLVDGTGYGSSGFDFVVTGSIFGSGNASSSAGPSTIYIRKLGERGEPDTAVSIQRADLVTLDDSHLELTGTTDRTNEYSTIKYSLNRIKKFVIKNDSSLLLRENANMLESFYSAVDINGQEEKATVTINDETKEVTKNVDNRLYLLADNILNVTTNESASEYGIVSGMTFMGMYQTYNNGTYVYGLYDESKTYGSKGDASDVIIGGSYVLGLHNLNHDITKDGFYTNYIDDDYTEITTAYIDPTPENTNFYMWVIGAASIKYEFNLTASKYSSLGTYELSMKDFTVGNTIFNVIGFNADGLTEGVVLKDSIDIPKIATNPEDANRVMGLAMKAETIEWANYGTTKFYKDPKSSYEGTTTYEADSQDIASSLMFYLYHAKNITSEEDLGTVVITLQAMVPVNEIEYEVKLITISINIDTKLYDLEDAYDASITYAKTYEMPSSTSVNITNKSQFTAYYSLFAEPEKVSDFYGNNNENYHALVSSYVLPVGTKITMLDFGYNETNPRHYYFIVDQENYEESLAQYQHDGEVSYRLSNFIRMDSIDKDNTYDDATNNKIYYHDDLNYIMEEYIFIFDFYDTNIDGEQLNNKMILELKTEDGFTKITVLGIRQDIMIYNLYESSNINLIQNAKVDNNYLYYDTPKDISYNTMVGYNQTELRQSIVDTNYESSSMGINITFYDTTGEQISSSMLGSTTITIDETPYYVDSNGVFRIKLTDKVSNLTRTLSLLTGNLLPTGRYTMRIALFASNDGLHNSSELEEVIKEMEIVVVGDNNMILAKTDDNSKLVIGETGLNMNDDNIEKFTITYHSVLKNPNIRVSLYKRDNTQYDSIEYNEIDINELFTDTFGIPIGQYQKQSDYEYMISTSPQESTTLTYNLKEKLISGTYKLVFKLYDENQLIDEDFEYIIVRKDIPYK